MTHSGLNKEQEKAVMHPGGPLLMAAGAGSGKTKALTSRLKELISRGTPPHEVIAITFTNKAAGEMRERVFGTSAKTPWSSRFPVQGHPFIGTFHSLGAKILNQELAQTGRKSGFSIFDSDDSLSLIKKICTALDLSKDQFRPPMVASRVSSLKSELKNADELLESPDKRDRIFYEIWQRYERALVENNAFDFDDLIEKPVRLFLAHPEILARYQTAITQVLVDEYQDINTAQYQLVRLLALKHKNLSVVGDDFQCLPPGTLISTPQGNKKIEFLKKGDVVTAASGHGEVCKMNISAVKKFTHRGPLIKITTTDGDILRLTPNHIVFARLQLTEEVHYVYLMYRKNKGFRIGLAKSSRWGKEGRQIGLIVRCNQEKADKMWILKVCAGRAEAEYYEYYYAFTYGIPTVVFDTNGRSMKLTQGHVDKLFSLIDTRKKAEALMKNELLYFSYPHWSPQGTIRHSASRIRIRLAFFDDPRKSIARPWSMSRISLNTSNEKLRATLEAAGIKTRAGKKWSAKNWRFESGSLDYGKLEQLVDKIQNMDTDLECVRSACLTDKKRLFFQPAAHLRPTMAIAVKNRNRIEEKIIKSVEIENYIGPVYDLDIENVHNYIANNIVVHNSIYAFRGADMRNFLNFHADWPDATIIKLEQNYRSTGNIISAASAVIKYNKLQTPKNLWTENPDGGQVRIVAAEDPDTEATWIANEIRDLQANSYKLQAAPSIGIIYRTNAQSRAIEQALISENIPYKIFGGLKFYDRKEIKDILAGLRLAVNPQDSMSIERLRKSLGVQGSKTVLNEIPSLGERLPAAELINFFIEKSNYKELLEAKFDNPQERLENIAELTAFAASFTTLEEFLERASLLQSSDVPAGRLTDQLTNRLTEPVNLMTIHIAKGLEFDYVFIAGCNEGTLPHEKSLGTAEEVEEERRLMYVAMTRARKQLYILFHAFPSRFLHEIPEELCDFVSVSGLMDKLPSEDDMWIEN